MTFTRKVLGSIPAYILFFANSAGACTIFQALNNEDFEQAEVVFEGSLLAIHPSIYPLDVSIPPYSSPLYNGPSERIHAMDVSFSVSKVIKGDLEKNTIRVGWAKGWAVGYPKSFRAFEKKYGRDVKVGLTTPNMRKRLCDLKDEQLFCKVSYTGLWQENSDIKSYIMNAPCSGPYMQKVNGDVGFERD